MRIVFLGTPEFAVPSLRVLLASAHEICAVFSQPDRPAGRGHRLHSPPVKVLAQDAGVPVYQPEKIRDERNRPLFEAFNPDFIVVVAYGQILPLWLLRSARVAPINVHASLLPQYRGAAPVIWAILRGESVTGVTTMLMDEQLDTGDILLMRQVPIPENMTGGELAGNLAQIGAEMLVPSIEGLSEGSVTPVPQDHTRASWAPRLTKDQAWISWDRNASEIHNQIRALNPRLFACATYQGQRLQVLRSRVSFASGESALLPGTVRGRTAEGLLVECADGTILEILEVRPPNRRAVSGCEFAVGARLKTGSRPFSPLESTRGDSC